MINENIGYIILEGSDSELEPNIRVQSVNKVNNKVIAETGLQTANLKNRNGRIYPAEELIPQISTPRIVELLQRRRLFGEMGHPLSQDLQRQSTIDETNASVLYTKIWNEGDLILAEYTTSNNEHGKALNQDILEGAIPTFSLRALGSLKSTPKGAEVRNLKMVTYDEVIYQSDTTAYTRRILSESTDIINKSSEIKTESVIIPITNEKIISYIQNESANLNFIRECFDYVYDKVEVTKNGTKVILTTKQGDVLVVNTESYIHNELMNYATEYEKFKYI